MHRSETIEERLASTGGRTTGFDYLRATLSISVIAFHSFVTSYGGTDMQDAWNSWWRPVVTIILPAFFALSGFLVAASLLRSKTIHEFLTLRVLRLVPALAFEVAISALILGPLLTVFSWREYFTSPLFRAYWLNIVGDIHFQLPGLFLNNPDPNLVNRQLWTIPVELKCYLAIAGMFLIGITRARWRMAALLALCIVAFPLVEMARGKDPFDPFGVSLSTKIMIESFLVGVAIYLFRDRLPLSRGLGVASAVLAFLCLSNDYAAYVAYLPIGYLTVWLGLSNGPRTVISRIGDYSYGLYIYGYTIQQAYSYLFPGFRVWWANLGVSLAVTFVCAAVSWHLLEKPVLGNRRHAVAAVDRAVSFVTGRLRFRRHWSTAFPPAEVQLAQRSIRQVLRAAI